MDMVAIIYGVLRYAKPSAIPNLSNVFSFSETIAISMFGELRYHNVFGIIISLLIFDETVLRRWCKPVSTWLCFWVRCASFLPSHFHLLCFVVDVFLDLHMAPSFWYSKPMMWSLSAEHCLVRHFAIVFYFSFTQRIRDYKSSKAFKLFVALYNEWETLLTRL